MNDYSKKLLGMRIKKRREELQLSQLELAKSIGKTSAAYLAFIESGDRNISTMDLMLLAKKLGMTVAELLGETTNERPQFSQLLRSSVGLSAEDKKKIEDYYLYLQSQKEEKTNTIEDIVEPRYLFVKSKAIEIWTVIGQGLVPVDLISIINSLGIPLKEEEFGLDGVATLGSDGICFIQYNKNAPEVRQRFTLAHELAHIVLEHMTIDGGSSQLSKDSQEKEANAFASELLIPSLDLKEFMKNKDKTISNIAERYKVSHDAAYYAISNNRLINKVRPI